MQRIITPRHQFVQQLVALYGARPTEEILIRGAFAIHCPTLMLIGKNRTDDNYSIRFDNDKTFTWHCLNDPSKDWTTNDFNVILTAINEVLL